MNDRYLVGREPLTEEEEFVLGIVENVMNTPIGEHELHLLMSIASSVSKDGMYRFVPKPWLDSEGNNLTGKGCLPYCERLHGVVDSLVRKNYLGRDPNDLKIFENKQLMLF